MEEFQAGKLNILNCWGQAKNNAAAMAGVHMRVQSCIKVINQKLQFIPCTSYSKLWVKFMLLMILYIRQLIFQNYCASACFCFFFYSLIECPFCFFFSETKNGCSKQEECKIKISIKIAIISVWRQCSWMNPVKWRQCIHSQFCAILPFWGGDFKEIEDTQ